MSGDFFEPRDLNGPLVREDEREAPMHEMGEMSGGGFGLGEPAMEGMAGEMPEGMPGEAMPPQFDMMSMDPDAAKREFARKIAPKLEAFAKKAARYVHELWKETDLLREKKSFKKRHTRNEKAGANSMRLTFKIGGQVDPASEDGHCKLGIKQGWGFQAQSVASSFLQQSFFEGAERFFVISGRGDKEENDSLPDMISDGVEKDFDDGNFEAIQTRLCNCAPQYGTAILEYEMIRELCFEKGPGGQYGEYRKKLRPSFTLWPIEDVWLTNPELPSALDQQGVFMVARGITRADLERDEQTYVIDTTDPFFPIRKKEGRYINLDRVRDAEDSHRLQYASSTSNTEAVTTGERGTGVSTAPKYDLYRYRGALPIQAWVADGSFDHELAQFYEIDVGLPLPPPGTELDPETKKEFARRLNRIPSFRFSYLRDGDSNSNITSFEHLVEFSVFDAKGRRNNAYKFPFFESAHEFHGLSISDVGWPIEAAADLLRNEQVQLARLAADPPGTYSKMGLSNPVVEEIQKLTLPGKRVPTEGRIKPGELLNLERFEPLATIEQSIAALKIEYELTTGMTGVAKGIADAKTLGQDQISQQNTQTRLNDVVFTWAKEMKRLIADMIRDRIDMDGEEAYAAFLKEVSGRTADDAEIEIPSADGIWREIKIDHPMTTGRDKAVMGQGLLNAKPLIPPGLVSEEKFWKLYLQTIGLPKSENIFENVYKPIDPAKEHEYLAKGTWISPNIQEDVMRHLSEHQMKLAEVQQELMAMQSGTIYPDPYQLQALQVFAQQLQQHIVATQQIMPMALQFQMQMAMSAKGIQPGPPGAMAPPGGQNPNAPGSEAQQGNAISANANEVPGASMAGAGSGY